MLGGTRGPSLEGESRHEAEEAGAVRACRQDGRPPSLVFPVLPPGHAVVWPVNSVPSVL